MDEARAEPPAAGMDVDKLTYEIFSILESKFLFGYDDPKLLFAGGSPHTPAAMAAVKGTPPRAQSGKVCILSIDGGGRAADGLLAGAALVRLEASLRRRTGDPKARLADFFDVAAGSGAGGVLAAMLVARGADDARPLFSAEDALAFLVRSLRRGWSSPSSGGGIRALFRRPAGAAFRKVFGELTLRDTARPVLVPCYDLATGAPFLFSRADAAERPAYDFRLRDVCAATCAGSDRASAAVEVRSCDGATRIVAVGGGVALGNPTAAAITHVLNNKREFPLASGVEDLLVISIGSGEGEQRPAGNSGGGTSTSEIVRIAAEGVSDMVDQAVAMAFGHSRASNYIRIQAMGSPRARGGVAVAAEEMLSQKNVESVLFRGKKLGEQTNADKLERFAHELVKERDRRASSTGAPAVVKQQPAAEDAAAPASYSNLVSQMFTSIL
ncbi:patatin-like protein 3 [Lolium rigidum]|uniref:patatin-like protein 3 n=1 Tax=Lolium rigidum TaxID=89674 RepID=UPI001F5D8C6B|nr:patatin-like protein 3 [Lolium rigidum]